MDGARSGIGAQQEMLMAAVLGLLPGELERLGEDEARRLVCGRLQFDCALRRISKVTS